MIDNYGPKIVLLNFEKVSPDSFKFVPDCRKSLLDELKKYPGDKPRIRKNHGLIVVKPNSQHFRVWGSAEEPMIEFVGLNS
jgi:hypothetical protein